MRKAAWLVATAATCGAAALFVGHPAPAARQARALAPVTASAPPAATPAASSVAASAVPAAVAQAGARVVPATGKHAVREREGREAREDGDAEAAERTREGNVKGDHRDHGPKPDHPGEAIAFRMLSLRDENGYIPPDGLIRAQQHMQTMRAATGPVANVAGITRGGWTWRGPGNIGGRTRALAINPSNTSVIFAGTVGGGIWKTTDGGTNWSVVDDFMANLAVTSIIYQPGSSTVMYAGTGEGFFNGDQIRGAGIFKSTDGGTTWTQLSSTANSNFYWVDRLAMSADGSTLLAGTSTGIFRSTNGGTSFVAATFNAPTPSSLGNTTISDVKFLPGSNTNAVAGSYVARSYYSTDGGATWSAATGFSGVNSTYGGTFTRVEVAPAASVANEVYAVLDASSGKLYKSTDGGATYAFVSTPADLSGQGWYDNAIWVDPTNDQRLVVGGLDLWRSINGGSTWTKISTWQYNNASVHADHHAIVSDPGYNGTSNARVYFGNDGGVYKNDNILTASSGNGTGGYTYLNHNFGATQFYSAAGNASSGNITGGTQDNGDLLYKTSTGPQGWSDRFGGDGGVSAYDPSDANTFYGEYVYLTVHRNTTGGAGFSDDIWGPTDDNWTACKPAPYRIDDACWEFSLTGTGGPANFIAPFVLDPNNANTMLAGGSSLWRSNDVKAALTPTTGPQWVAIKGTIGTPINAIAVAPGNSALIYVGYNNGDVYMTTNGTAATPVWSKVDSVSMPNSQVQRIAIDPNNNNSVWVSFGGYTTTNLWHSTNGASSGATWNLSTGSGGTALPAAPIRGIAIHPTQSGWVYVGTEVGIFASTDGGATWSLPTDGPANVSVDELTWMGTTLVAATHGRGVYTSPTTGTTFATQISMDTPANGASVTRPFTVSGWAINRTAASGTGVDGVQIYVTPSGGSATFLGVASYGTARSDIGALYGSQFTNSGWTLSNAGGGLAPGTYTVTAYAHNAASGTFDATASATITVSAPVSNGLMTVESPTNGQVLTSAFEVGGWAIDAGAPSGSGVDGIQFYVQPVGSPAPGVFVGTGSVGAPRPDVAAAFGSQFTNSGFHFTITGLGPGNFVLGVYAHSTVTNSFSIVRQVAFSVNANQLMSIDAPSPEATVPAGSTFSVAGWSIDRASSGTTSTGVDALHIYAYPNPGSGTPPIFLGVASLGFSRPDVGAIYGSQYNTSGYQLIVNAGSAGLTPGVYNIAVVSHSTSGSFNNLAVVRITVQ